MYSFLCGFLTQPASQARLVLNGFRPDDHGLPERWPGAARIPQKRV